MKLLNKINENSEIIRIKLPLGELCPKITLNSLNKEILIVFISTIVLLDTTHRDDVIINKNKTLDTQLIDVFIDVEGSKIENRFLIMLIYFPDYH